jgi:hypothetical protein
MAEKRIIEFVRTDFDKSVKSEVECQACGSPFSLDEKLWEAKELDVIICEDCFRTLE